MNPAQLEVLESIILELKGLVPIIDNQEIKEEINTITEKLSVLPKVQ